MDELDKLRALEREIEREWWWLNGALHAIAQVNSGDPGAYLEMLTRSAPWIASASRSPAGLRRWSVRQIARVGPRWRL